MVVQGNVLVARGVTMGELGLVTRTKQVAWYCPAVSQMLIAEDVMTRGVTVTGCFTTGMSLPVIL